MKNIKLLGLLALILLGSCSQDSKIERPRDVWVFRSVLDERPRMLTAALHDDLWVAYDVQSGIMYKAWKGGVLFDGAVYTTTHGPQPTSRGYAYFTNETDQWLLKKGNTIRDAQVSYVGHEIKDGRLFIKYNLITQEGKQISISENPEFKNRGNQNGLERVFQIDNQTDVVVGLKTRQTSLFAKEDFTTTGTFDETGFKQSEFTGGTVHSLSGVVWMDKPSVNIKIFYHPGFDQISQGGDGESSGTAGEPTGAKMIAGSDCSACHNETLKTVGPAYLTIAKKYNDSESAIKMLAKKIIDGGSGVWGNVPMTPHPDLAEADAQTIAAYILSLDDGETNMFDKFALGIKSVPLDLSDQYDGGSGNGFMAHLYLNPDELDPLELVKVVQPIRQGPVDRIHTLQDGDFKGVDERFVVKYDGLLKIEQDGSYDFRLISDDGSYLFIDDKMIIDNGGKHGPTIIDGEMYLTAGDHPITVIFEEYTGGALISAQWFNKEAESFELLNDKVVTFTAQNVLETKKYIDPSTLVKSIPGDGLPLDGVHPSFNLAQARPDDFTPRVGGIDFFSDGRMAVCTWDSTGPVYLVDKWQTGDPAAMTHKRIAFGLAEPLGLKIVDDRLFVLQKQELTELIDNDGDDVIDEYRTVSDKWRVSANFHEFAFGLVYKDGYFYASLATAIMPGGASANPQIPDRGKVVKINMETGDAELIAHGLRTPNGIGEGVDGELFIADNQGDWLPASKIVHVKEGAFYGSRSVNFEGTEGLKAQLPVVWLPQDEIGNSPSTPMKIDVGPYKGQMIHGEVTHGGIKRAFVEEVNGNYQGAVFRFTQGLEAGVNRIIWGPNGLVIGGVGAPGNWGHIGKQWYGLQSLTYNEVVTFEMLSVSARSNGFEITFTEPIKEGQNIKAEDFLIQQWYYEPTENYGGPKLELETLSPVSFALNEDRTSVFIQLDGLKENHLVYFRIINPFVSASENELWTTEAWYTLNSIPKDKKGFTADYQLAHNQLTKNEQNAGWKLLFDGKSTDGLRNYLKQSIGSKWIVDDGTLHFIGQGAGTGGDVIITDKEYENYELYLEWKIAKGGNSGIIYNVVESEEYETAWRTGPELQILDNERHPDAQIHMHRAGDLYDMIPTKFITVNKAEEWNRILLRVNNGHVEHWQNGYKVVEFDLWSSQWDEMVAKSKFKDMPAFGTGKKGHIVLQDHGDKVWFRNIKVREL
ncbi:MAG: DUF1080 domain-containing protein [Cyclobacteriaceae bacterium]